MSTIDRRKFLQALGSGAFATALPDSISKALAIPANNRTGTIADVEHIVILTQENRSFDHYFGTTAWRARFLRSACGHAAERPTGLVSTKRPRHLWHRR